MSNGKWSNSVDIKTGDILYCNYPYLSPNNTNTHPHYVLVADFWSENSPEGEQWTFLTVYYGTSKKTEKLYKYEILVSNDTCYNFCKTGLTIPTKFDLDKYLDMRYDNINFCCKPPKTTPRVGNINFNEEPILKTRLSEIKRKKESE